MVCEPFGFLGSPRPGERESQNHSLVSLQLTLQRLVLEFARRGYEELSAFSELDPKIGLGIGVIDIKDNEVESRELIASRIEKIAKTIGAERLHYVHPDCGFWMLQRSVVDRKMRALVEGRDLFEGRE